MNSHILTKRDKVAVNGEYGISSSSAYSGRCVASPGPPRARSRGGEHTSLSISTLEQWRSSVEPSTRVTRAVCYLHMDFSSLSKLSRGTWNGFLDPELSGDCSASSSSVQFRCADLCFQSSFPCFVAIASILISCITNKTQCVRGLPVRLRHCRSLSKPGDYVLPF